jgi:hypothetical protein
LLQDCSYEVLGCQIFLNQRLQQIFTLELLLDDKFEQVLEGLPARV